MLDELKDAEHDGLAFWEIVRLAKALVDGQECPSYFWCALPYAGMRVGYSFSISMKSGMRIPCPVRINCTVAS